jgi:DNA-binding PadR family transcriptional regulator
MPVPEITNLQFMILGWLMNESQSGHALRAKLATEGVSRSAPAFYQLMARLEDAKLVVGRYESRSVAGRMIKERSYKIDGKGIRAWESARDFYLEVALSVNKGGLARA